MSDDNEGQKKENVWDIVDRIAQKVFDEGRKKEVETYRCLVHGTHNNLLTITTDLETEWTKKRIFCLYCLCRILAGIEMQSVVPEAPPVQRDEDLQ